MINEEDNFLLFIEIMNIFESILLSFYHLKLKSNYMIILLRNFEQNMSLCNETRL